MDEPTNGLDIPSKSQFRKVVAHGMRDDQIVVISTHQVRDVETLLDHVTIIEQNAVLLNERMNMEARQPGRIIHRCAQPGIHNSTMICRDNETT